MPHTDALNGSTDVLRSPFFSCHTHHLFDHGKVHDNELCSPDLPLALPHDELAASLYCCSSASHLLRLSPTTPRDSFEYQWSEAPTLALHAAVDTVQIHIGTAVAPPGVLTKPEMSRLGPSSHSAGYSIPAITVSSSVRSDEPSSSMSFGINSASHSYSASAQSPPEHSTTAELVVPAPSSSATSPLRTATARSSDSIVRKRRRQRLCDLTRRQKQTFGYDRLYALLTNAGRKQSKRAEQREEKAEETERKENKHLWWQDEQEPKPTTKPPAWSTSGRNTREEQPTNRTDDHKQLQREEQRQLGQHASASQP